MPANSQHRPGVQVAMTLEQYIAGKLQRSKELQEQLAASKGAEAAGVRSQLCSELSEVLLSDPKTAQREDCTGRLFTYCFYKPIKQLRMRLMKERKNQTTNLPRVEKTFDRTIQEALQLYEYLLEQYYEKLFPEQSQQLSQGSLPPPSTDTAGVVEGLFRMYIHMGDVHRYHNNYEKAEDSYEKAVLLAPGNGNPFNQLAVLSSSKDPQVLSCVGLYQYARALLATHDPFDTSHPNLGRHFSSNRALLEQQPEPEKMNTRLLLSQFVDLHCDFYRGLDTDQANAMMQRIGTILEHFGTKSAAAFSDALWCKMVAINAMSIELGVRGKASHDPATTQALARAFLLLSGSSLAERVEHSAAKSGVRSVRFLAPLCLFAEYVSRLEHVQPPSNLAGFCNQAQFKFWTQLAKVTNQLLTFEADVRDVTLTSMVSVKEFKVMKGFAPFAPFIDPDYSRSSPYVAVEEAIEALGQGEDAPPAASKLQANKLKITMLLDLANRVAMDSSNPSLANFGRNDRGQYVWREQEPIASPGSKQEVDDDGDNLMPDDDGGDVLVFVPQEDGPSLLMPTALMPAAQPAVEVPKSPKLLADPKPMETAPTEESSDYPSLATKRPPPGLAPPPGFGQLSSIVPPSSDPPASTGLIPGLDESFGIVGTTGLFGGPLHTSNPFAMDPTTPSVQQQPSSNFSSGDEAAFLDSGLLNSLWMDDSTAPTKNPFAT